MCTGNIGSSSGDKRIRIDKGGNLLCLNEEEKKVHCFGFSESANSYEKKNHLVSYSEGVCSMDTSKESEYAVMTDGTVRHFKQGSVSVLPKLHKIGSVTCGPSNAFFVGENLDLYGLGNNEFGQLGFPRWNSLLSPEQILIVNPPTTRYEIFAGLDSTFLLSEEGTIWCSGRLGGFDRGIKTFAIRYTNTSVASIVPCHSFTLFLMKDGSLFCFGTRFRMAASRLKDIQRKCVYPSRIPYIDRDIMQIMGTETLVICLRNNGQLFFLPPEVKVPHCPVMTSLVAKSCEPPMFITQDEFGGLWMFTWDRYCLEVPVSCKELNPEILGSVHPKNHMKSARK